MDKELKKCDVQIRQMEKKIEKLNYEESKAYQGYVTGEVSKRRVQAYAGKVCGCGHEASGTDF